MRTLTLVLGLFVSMALAADTAWTPYSTKDGVQSAYRAIPGTGVFAMRGQVDTDLPMGKVLGYFLDDARSEEWVDMMVAFDKFGIAPNVQVERQVYDMPWPVSDREFVLRRTVSVDPARGEVSVVYKSVDDGRFPAREGFVRGIDHGSTWSFQRLNNGGSRITIEVAIDPMGGLPDWLVNSIQRAWPHDTLVSLLSHARATHVTPWGPVADW